MNPSHDDELIELADFKEFLSATIGGEPPLLAGGHADHSWAIVYWEEIGEALYEWLPLTSKYHDLSGTQSLLIGLKDQFGAAGPMTIILDDATDPYLIRVLPIQTFFQGKVANLAHSD
jgi:hypothetical protein